MYNRLSQISPKNLQKGENYGILMEIQTQGERYAEPDKNYRF